MKLASTPLFASKPAPCASEDRSGVEFERLFAHRRDLLTRLDLVFMDTTSLYFEGAGGQTLGRYGYSKDHRPDLRQMILAVVIDGDGRPVCSEMWPGNTADVTTLIPVIDRLRARFAIARVCVVADRSLISADTLAALEARRLLYIYILGVRERSDKLRACAQGCRSVAAADDEQAWQARRRRGQDGAVGRAALHRLPQSSGSRKGCRRPRRDRRRAGAPTCKRRQGAGRQQPVFGVT